MTQAFPIPPATGKGVWIIIAVMVLLIALTLMMTWVVWSTRNSRAEVTPDGLKLVGDLWGRTIPHEQILADDARIIDLRQEPDLTPRARTAGTALGGFSAGWFRLRNGEKSLIYLTDRSRVVYLRTTNDYSVMLSTSEPERLISALRAH